MRKAAQFTVFLLIMGSQISLATGASPEDLWQEAKRSYEAGNFSEAAQHYRELASGWPGGWVYYNLGNACFKAGQLGEAVLAYKRARRLLPRSREIKENLSQAQRAVGMEQHEPKSVGFSFRTALHFLTAEEWLFAFSFLFLPGVLAGISWTCTRVDVLRTIMYALVGVSILLLLVYGLRGILDISYQEAVVMSDESFGYVAPHLGEEKAFRTTAGNLVFLMKRQTGDWTEVALMDGTRGWLRNEDFVPVVKGNRD